ncbi:MAG TPA: hypothetical protein VGN59_12610 [Acidimicrobiia bacterium]
MTTLPTIATRDASDLRLVGEVAEVLAVPREDPADSFVLHAPLELIARTALLPYVDAARRPAARDRITAVGTELEAFGPPVARPAADELESLPSATEQLVAAVGRGELDDVDRVARWLGRSATPTQLRTLLARDVVPRLAAAAHAPIFLFELPRVAPRGEVTGELLRGLARELGRAPEWRIHWIDERDRSGDAPSAAEADVMFAALAETPLGTSEPGDSPFIYPVMSRVDGRDGTGVAAGLLDPVTGGHDVAVRGRAVLRASAWSMLLEPGDHAPYGWSHCLTMPQAVLGLTDVVDPSTALAVASTFVVGFRSAFAVQPLEPRFPHDDPGLAVPDAIDAGPDAAAAAVWHHADPRSPEIVGELATRASVQGDAHLVKYTLACLDAAEDDRAHARLFLAAAASLSGWWAEHGDGPAPG